MRDSAEYVRERMYADGLSLLDGKMRMALVKSGFIIGAFYRTTDDYGMAFNVVRTSSIEEQTKLEQRVYAHHPKIGL